MSFVILGVGTALPEHTLTQDRAAEVARVLCRLDEQQSRIMDRLYRRSNINTRHFVVGHEVVDDILDGTRTTGSIFLPSDDADDLGPTTAERMSIYAEKALPLALSAAREALVSAELSGAAVTHLVTVSCTGFAAPGVDVGLIRELELRPTVQRVHIGFMGCHGAINGLRVAAAFAAAQPDARVLVCAVELCGLHFHYRWNPIRNTANALFADGAAAAVGLGSTAVRRNDWAVTATGSCLFPDSESAMQWQIGDHGFDMMLSAEVPELILRSLRPWLAEWLRGHGLTIEGIGSWAVHPGGPRILSAVAEALSLPGDALEVSRRVLEECGNMSSPTVLFILERFRRQQAPRPCLMLGFGPGLVAEVALLQ